MAESSSCVSALFFTSVFDSSLDLFWPTAGRILNLLGLEPLDVLEFLEEEVLEEEVELSSLASSSVLSSESFSLLVDVLLLILILWFLIVAWLGLVCVLPPDAPRNLQLAN